MNRLFKLTAPLFAIAATLALVTGTHAADNQAQITLEGVDLGTHVHGPEVEATDLSGKVVLFEYWGDRCPPCIRAIPLLVKKRAEYGEDKLAIVANQVWTKDIEQAKKAWTNAGGNDKITVVNHGKLQGAQVRGVPHAFLLDHNGKLLWRGHPMSPELNTKLKEAVEAIPNAS